MDEQEGSVVWDARQDFTRQVVYRISLFLDCDTQELRKKFERLVDLYLLVVGYIKEYEKVRKDIYRIECLLWPTAGNKENINDARKQAAKEITDVYIKIIMEISPYMLLPKRETQDPNRAFAQYYPKK